MKIIKIIYFQLKCILVRPKQIYTKIMCIFKLLKYKIKCSNSLKTLELAITLGKSIVLITSTRYKYHKYIGNLYILVVYRIVNYCIFLLS